MRGMRIFLVALALCIGCTPSTPEPNGPKEAASAAPQAKDAPLDPGEPGARVAANSPLAGKDERSGQERPFSGDDPGKSVPLSGKRAFALGPGESWVIGLYDFIRTEGTKNVFKGPPGERDFAIPGAYTRMPSPLGALVKGAVVRVPYEIETICGRVVSASEREVRVAVLDENKRVERVFAPDQVLALSGKLDFASPVAFKQSPGDKAFSLGVLVYQDERYAWLQSATRVDAGQAKAVDTSRVYKVGDAVFAVPNDGAETFVPGTITKVLDDGLQYEIKTKEGALKVADLCSVTSSL